MKKLTVLVLAVLSVSTKINSQITKGNWLLGGNISFSSTSLKSEIGQKNTFFILQVAPDIGYFIADKFVAGLKVSISSSGSKATGTSVFGTQNDYNFGPFARYYFLSTEKQFNILTEGTYQYGFIGRGQQNTKTSKNTFAIAAGPVIYFNSSVGLEFLIGYSTHKYVGFAGSNGTIQLGIGFHVHLEKNKN